MRSTKTSPIWALAMVAALGLGLAACSSSDDPAPPPPVDPDPTPDPVAMERDAINDAIAAARSAAAMVMDDSTDAVVDAADTAVAAAMAAIDGATLISAGDAAGFRASLATVSADLAAAKSSRMMVMDLAGQRMAVADAIAAAMTAVGMVNDTADDATVAAADAAITAAMAAIAGADDIPNSEADAARTRVAALQTDLATAKSSRQMAMDMLQQEADQKAALMAAAGMIDTSDMMTADEIVAANAAISALRKLLAASDAVNDADKAMYEAQAVAAEADVKASQSALSHADQTKVLMSALADLQAINLSDLSDQAKIDAANAAIAALQTALDGATELSDAEKAAAMAVLTTADRNVMTAQRTLDIDTQMTTLSEAVAELAALDLNALMTQAEIDAADAAIVKLDLALAAATLLTDAQKLDATVDVTVAKRRVASAQTALDENVGNQRTALMNAGTALGEIDLTDLDTAEKIAAANAAIADLRMALAGATHLSDSEKATYQMQLDDATEDVRMAQTGMDREDRMTAQRMAITSAIEMARTAVGNVDDDSTASEVAAADSAIAALKQAIEDAVDLPEGNTYVAMAQGTLATLEPQLAAAKSSRDDAIAARDEEQEEMMAEVGKALHAALGSPATPVGTTGALANINLTTPDTDLSDGLTIAATAGAGAVPDADTPDSAILVAGDSAGSLGGWMGTDYALSTGTGEAKVSHEARVYTNRGMDMSQPFDATETGGKYTLVASGDLEGWLLLTAADGVAPPSRARAAAFMHDGTQNHPIPDNNVALIFSGTYDGASGQFRCTGACTSANDGKDGPSALGGEWHFKPNTGATVRQPDPNYLYYGWWIHKDHEDDPLAASAFTGVNGAIAALTDDPAAAVTGSATYSGNAAGKYAIDNVLDGTGHGGHFTADANLTAKFGTNDAPNNGGISGTIDNFRLNDASEDPGWSVTLNRAPWDGTTPGAFASSAADNTTADGTVWSIGGNAAPESGNWSGQMYDELPGNTDATPPGDGSNIPTTVTGMFYSEFSTIGRMVGAFGADRQ